MHQGVNPHVFLTINVSTISSSHPKATHFHIHSSNTQTLPYWGHGPIMGVWSLWSVRSNKECKQDATSAHTHPAIYVSASAYLEGFGRRGLLSHYLSWKFGFEDCMCVSVRTLCEFHRLEAAMTSLSRQGEVVLLPFFLLLKWIKRTCFQCHKQAACTEHAFHGPN